MSRVDESLAVQTADDNDTLRLRVKRLDEDEQRNNTVKTVEPLDTTSADRLKSKIGALRQDIADLEQELTELRLVNVTALKNQYQRLDNKRAHLNNENTSLRNVLANQSRDVRRATNTVNAFQEVRRQNEEQNASAKDDVRMFRERRAALMKESKQLNRKEARLQSELESIPVTAEALEMELERLAMENAKKSVDAEELESELAELRAQQADGAHEEEERRLSTSAADVADMRREYVELKEQLRQLQQQA